MQRLKTRPQFQAVLAGETVARTPHFALHRQSLVVDAVACEADKAPCPPLFGVQDVWMGAMVPKRWARRAVTRNAIKRQIYGLAAEHAPRLPVAAHVVRLRAAFDRKHFISATSEPLRRAVRAELIQLFERACRAPRSPAVGRPVQGGPA
jgi:ribonuclease P protein component